MKSSKLPLLYSIVLFTSACSSGGDGNNTPVNVSTNDPASTSNGYYNSTIVRRDGTGVITAQFRDVIDVVNNVVTGFSTDLTDGREFQDIQYKYDDKGNMIQSVLFDDTGNVRRQTDYTHDSQGYLRSYRIDDFEDDSIDRESTIFYDEQNKIIRREFKSFAGELRETHEYMWTENDLIDRRESTFFEDGQISSQGIRTYTYDDQQRIIGNAWDSPIDGTIDERREYQYDDKGNMVLETRFDAAGQLDRTTEHGYVVTGEPIFNLWIRIFKYFP